VLLFGKHIFYRRDVKLITVVEVLAKSAASCCGKKSVGENKFFSPFSDDIVNAEKGAKSIISS
ncbi:hypothetical protein ACUOA5_24015, partial [Escherichia coli]